MRIFGLQIRRRPRPVQMVREPMLTEEELTMAFSRVGLKHPLYQAVLQLVDTLEDNAHHDAAQALQLGKMEAMAGYVMVAEQMRMLRNDMETRRREAFTAIAARQGVDKAEI